MRSLIIAACLAVSTTPVLAADANSSVDDAQVITADGAAAEPVAERWGGAYVGVSVGAGFLWDTLNATGRGAIGGGYAGYNVQQGNLVVGIEAGGQWAPITFNDGSGVASKLLFEGRLRAGLASDKWLAYGSIGAQHATSNLVLAPATPPIKDTAIQWGGGIEYAVTNSLSTGVDYTYAHFKNFGNSGIGVKVQKVQARLAYKFN